jgi:hypothetical protein
VACWSTKACVAVGQSGSGLEGSPTKPLVESWNGSAWVQAKLPGTASGGLNGVSCAGTSAGATCVAAGAAGGGPLVLVSNGAGWTKEPTPKLTTPAVLLAVDCTSSSSCEAVGSHGSRSLAEIWNGSAWSVQPTANRQSSDVRYGVSCSAAANCAAVGYWNGPEYGTQPLAEAWNGSAWSRQKTPYQPGTTNVSMAGVVCPSPGACVAVGSNNAVAAVEVEKGGSWVAQPAVPGYLEQAQSTLGAVSCGSDTSCVAVGSTYASIRDTFVGMIETWNGSHWRVLGFQQPASSDLVSVACPSPTACLAVGSAQGGLAPLAEWWDGTAWSVVSPPPPGQNQYASFSGVSCVSPILCTVAGSFIGENGDQPLIEVWNGSSWAQQTVPAPADAIEPILSAISCFSTDICEATGLSNSYEDPEPFAVQWNGTAWSDVTVPQPAGASLASLPGLSCAGATTCVAVGYYFDATSNSYRPLAETWNGSSWSIGSVPLPASADGRLAAVSCPSIGECTATGEDTMSTGQDLILADVWDGTAWSKQSIPATGVEPYLAGVFCWSSASCVAVGARDEGEGPTLVETYS